MKTPKRITILQLRTIRWIGRTLHDAAHLRLNRLVKWLDKGLAEAKTADERNAVVHEFTHRMVQLEAEHQRASKVFHTADDLLKVVGKR